MSTSANKGNNGELWDKLLIALDERLQLGLLDHLTRVKSYHFEQDILYIEPNNPNDREYLTKSTTTQQLELLAQDTIKVVKVIIK